MYPQTVQVFCLRPSFVSVGSTNTFWKRLSVGLLGTARIDGKYSWYEGRASANLALFRCLSLTANYAYSTFGQNYGAALNFHPKGINLLSALIRLHRFLTRTLPCRSI